MLLETEAGIWARADATVFKLMMDGGRTERRLQAVGRTIASAHRRVAALRSMNAAAEARAHAAAAREIDREFGPSWGKAIHVRVTPAPRQSVAEGKHQSKTALRARTPPRTIRAYKAPLKDARGRIALYFRIRYVGLKSNNWRPGLAADHALYILREQAMEGGEIALDVLPLSNMGQDAEEIAACWKALEAMEEGYRANAKVQYRIIWNLPHGLDAEQRREMVEDFCKRTFGRLGLPWVAAVHKADARGDQRNFHAHVCFSTRPCERTGNHQWSIAQEKVNGLTDEAGLKLMRTLVAGHMNVACRDAGLAARFTHQTYRERRIDAERQEHVGPAAMAAHEAGGQVAVIDRNARRVEAAELAAERDATARILAATDCLILVEQRRVVSGRMIDRLRERGAGARRIAALARAQVATIPRTRDFSLVASLAANIAVRARALRAVRTSGLSRATVRSMLPVAKRIDTHARDINDRQAQYRVGEVRTAAVRSLLASVSSVVKRRADAAAIAGRDRAKAIIMTAPVPPYTLADGRAAANFSGLSAADQTLIRSLDRETLVATLRQRIQRDIDEQAAQRREGELKAQEARARAEQLDAQVRYDPGRAASRDEEGEAKPKTAARSVEPTQNDHRTSRPDRNPTAKQPLGCAVADISDAERLARRRRLAWAAGYRETLMEGWRDVRRLDPPMAVAVEPDRPEATMTTPSPSRSQLQRDFATRDRGK